MFRRVDVRWCIALVNIIRNMHEGGGAFVALSAGFFWRVLVRMYKPVWNVISGHNGHCTDHWPARTNASQTDSRDDATDTDVDSGDGC